MSEREAQKLTWGSEAGLPVRVRWKREIAVHMHIRQRMTPCPAIIMPEFPKFTSKADRGRMVSYIGAS
ncbi:hypothetical protein GCM10009805_22090 [Leucobacter chromiireducens subsp. solipictus]